MCGGKVFNSWRGPGDTYPRTHTLGIISANMASRWMPFREESLARSVMAPSGQNRSGQSWEQAYGLMTADEVARQENFKF